MINNESLPALPRGATLEPDGEAWLLRYSIPGHDYGERFPGVVDIAIPVVAQSCEDALALARLILAGVKAYPRRRQNQLFMRQ